MDSDSVRLTRNKSLLPSAERLHTVNPAGMGGKPYRAVSSVSPAARLSLTSLTVLISKTACPAVITLIY